MLILVSISPTFYKQLFRTKDLRAAFLYLNCRFKLFWCKEIGAKAACKMLVKLTTRLFENASHLKVRKICSSGSRIMILLISYNTYIQRPFTKTGKYLHTYRVCRGFRLHKARSLFLSHL